MKIENKISAIGNLSGVYFHRNKAWSHSAKNTQTKNKVFGWDPRVHPPYIQGVVTFAYNLFRSMQYFLTRKLTSCAFVKID